MDATLPWTYACWACKLLHNALSLVLLACDLESKPHHGTSYPSWSLAPASLAGVCPYAVLLLLPCTTT